MNINITQFRWSNKALEEMGIATRTIKQIEDICKVHDIKIKE